MAKSHKHATLICIVLTILAALGIAIGYLTSKPVIIIIFLLPTVFYEAYRTEGISTRLASWLLLAIVIGEFILIAADIKLDLAAIFGTSAKYIRGYKIPMGDIKIVAPMVMGILSILLLVRTRGIYTRWLALIILITSFAIVYTLDPTIVNKLFGTGIQKGLQKGMGKIK